MTAAPEHLQRVAQGMEHRFQILFCSLFRTGQIYNEGLAPGSRRRPGEHGRGVMRRLAKSIAWGMAGISRSTTARVASGVTSGETVPFPRW